MTGRWSSVLAGALRLRGFPALPAFGMAAAVGLLAGVGLALARSAVLAPGWSWTCVLAGLMLLLAAPRWRLPAALLLGLGWASLHAGWALDARLPYALQGEDIVLSGRVAGLPQRDVASLRFDFRVDSGSGLEGRQLRLAWYGRAPELQPGSRWQLQVRLKRPRGSSNPGGWDYERHALQRGIAATGYVREAKDNRELAGGAGIDLLRAQLSDAIAAAVGTPRARFVQALTVADTRALDERDWEILRATGITHLIAISGMHVGLVAGFGALFAALLFRLRPGLGLRLPLPQAAAVLALLSAAAYTALAGFELPTVRTLLMIAAALLAVMLRRAASTTQALALALIAVLLVDPLSILGAGFWLSFLGVAWLLWCLPREAWSTPLRSVLSAQGVMSLALLPLTVWFFGQASVAGPLVNLIAVPWVSFVVVPVALVGAALTLLMPALGAPVLVASGWLMQGLWLLVEPVAGLKGALVYLPEPSPLAVGLSLLGALWLLLPRGVPGKPLALCLLLPLLLPSRPIPAPGQAEVWLLDVGQGLSVLVRTHGHALLYDAGPSSPGGRDAGDAVVVPAMRAIGVDRLDVYVESHGDNDHAGGSESVLRAFAPDRVYASDPRRQPQASACEHGIAWEWDGVEFELLHPPSHFPYLKNDSSCVLRVAAAGTALLLPGDISEVIESRLRREQAAAIRADVLLIPHHGSLTSSGADFIAAVEPAIALLGVGHRNRFALPREEVLERYRAAGVRVLDSASNGAIRLRLDAGGVGPPLLWREQTPRLWREASPCIAGFDC